MKHLYIIFICLLGSLYTAAQCPAGETEITIELTTAAFATEKNWEIFVDGVSVSGPLNGPQVVTFCAGETSTITIDGCDTFGDGWDGTDITVTNTEDGSVNGCGAQDGCLLASVVGLDDEIEDCDVGITADIVSLTLGACATTPVNGCTDPMAANFNACATADDGSCVLPIANDCCTTAAPLPVGGGCTLTIGDNTGATDCGEAVPSCSNFGGGDAWYSVTVPPSGTITIEMDADPAGSPITDMGMSVYSGDCMALTEVACDDDSGNGLFPLIELTGQTPGDILFVQVFEFGGDTEGTFGICANEPCTSPVATATAVCVPGDDSGFYVEVDVTDFGGGNTAYTVDIGGPQTPDITAAGVVMYGPFPSGTPVDVVLAGAEDATCGLTITGLDKPCNIVDGIAEGDTFCSSDAAVTVTANVPPDTGLTAVQTVDGAFDGEHGIGLYAGTWDDGSVIGLPPAGTGLFGTDTETSIEGSTPGANDITTVGNWGDPSAVGNTVISAPLMDGATYTVYIVDDFGDGWDGSDVDLVDCEGNVVVANLAQFIDAIAADAQDELAWTTFTYTAPAASVTWSGTGTVTDDPDGVPNSGDEVYTFDPAMAGATGCDPLDVQLTMSVLSCGVTCDEIVNVTVYPPLQAPTITLDDAVCNYTIAPACPNDVLDVTMTTATPDSDPAPIDVTVTNANGCTATFPVDPPACAALMGCTDPCADNYDPAATEDDGSCNPYDDTCNADCTAGPFGGTWDPNTCACINETAPVNGCMDATACNYDPAANCDDGSCLPAPVCNTDPCVGDIEIVDPNNACACITDTPQVLGCTDATADNYDPAANCDDGSCMTAPMCSISVSISSFACNDSGTPEDPADDTVTFEYTVIDNNGTGTTWSSDQGDAGAAYGTVIAVGPILADGSTWTINVTDDGDANCTASTSQVLNSCPTVENIPTVGEWGLIILGLLMTITAVIGIRQRRENEVYS